MQERLAGCSVFSGTGYASLLFYDQFAWLMCIRRVESRLWWLLKMSVLHLVNMMSTLMAWVRALQRGKRSPDHIPVCIGSENAQP